MVCPQNGTAGSKRVKWCVLARQYDHVVVLGAPVSSILLIVYDYSRGSGGPSQHPYAPANKTGTAVVAIGTTPRTASLVDLISVPSDLTATTYEWSLCSEDRASLRMNTRPVLQRGHCHVYDYLHCAKSSIPRPTPLKQRPTLYSSVFVDVVMAF